MDRNETIARLRKALKASTGRTWSVTGGRGTAWGWITVTAPPARRAEYGYMTDDDCRVLADALRLEAVHCQGVSIPSQTDFRQEYLDRAEGRAITTRGVPQWD